MYSKRLAVTLCLVLAVAAAFAAPKADLWPRWQANDPADTRMVDHSFWAAFLRRYLVTDDPSGINLFRYAAVSQADRAGLEAYLRKLQQIRVSGLNRDEQMAFWINLYNAFTVKLVLDAYPVSSILRIDPDGGLIPRGPWEAKIITVEDTSISLNDIEHRVLRPIWHDNRIHYAVNCASLGCPNLQPEPFTASNLDRLLDRGAHDYVNHPRGARFERGILNLSSIFKWYQSDFGTNEREMLLEIAKYAEPALAEKLRSYTARIRYSYDWNLNEILQ